MVVFSQLQSFLLLISSYWSNNQCPLTWNHLYPQNELWELSETNFDFIIVGAGTAGSVLANRLTEIENFKVLLIEAGSLPSNLSEIPGLFLSLQKTKEDWSFVSEKSEFACKGYKDERCNWPQGKGLGGGSMINAMLYSPGVPRDYDNWETLGNVGWNWSTVEPYFKKLNQYLDKRGYLKSTAYQSSVPGRALLVSALNELGIEINSGKPIGYKDVNITVVDGQRFSMAKAYLSPIKERPNLKVLTDTLVTKIIIKNKRAIGVEIDTKVGVIKIHCCKDVIVTAGNINSAKLLLLSGIGPEDHLISKGIKVKENLPVGNNMKDHLIVPIFVQLPEHSFTLNFTETFDAYCTQRIGLNDSNMANFQGFINTKGRLDLPDTEFVHFLFPKNDSIILETFLEKFSYNKISAQSAREANQNASILLFLPTLLHPKSSGFVRLKNVDPKSDPLIYPEFFTEPEDLLVFLEGFDFILEKILKTKAFETAVVPKIETPKCRHLTFNTKDYWTCYIHNFATTIWHNSGTCRMGSEKKTSVVDNRLRVHGIKNLRVADSSALPDIISGHTNVPVCMFAEKTSDIIKEDYLN